MNFGHFFDDRFLNGDRPWFIFYRGYGPKVAVNGGKPWLREGLGKIELLDVLDLRCSKI